VRRYAATLGFGVERLRRKWPCIIEYRGSHRKPGVLFANNDDDATVIDAPVLSTKKIATHNSRLTPLTLLPASQLRLLLHKYRPVNGGFLQAGPTFEVGTVIECMLGRPFRHIQRTLQKTSRGYF
jgi:hypothetical protein